VDFRASADPSRWPASGAEGPRRRRSPSASALAPGPGGAPRGDERGLNVGFLSDLLPRVRSQIDDPLYLDGLPDLPPRRAPSLREAVVRATNRWAILVERKHESPGSTEPALPELPLDRFIEEVREGGADGLSCLATTPAFHGSPREVADLVRVSKLPVLFKDFVIDPLQVEAAYRTGASAILLIARLESGGFLDIPIRELAMTARARGLEVLLEVHDPDEWPVADDVAVDLFGVNLRDLDTLRFEPEVVEDTFRTAGTRRPLLGLSGVSSPEEAARFRQWGADGLLVGTGFARAGHPASFLRSLRVALPR
jgi:indole-3-glycerol phosphate synthase